jgi:hypothetical protein
MEQNKLKAFIDEVAVIKKPHKNVKPKKVIKVIENEFGEEETIVEFETDSNPTLPFELSHLKPIEKLCQMGCGDMVKDQVIEKRLALTPQRHWRTRCASCQAYLHPDGKTIVHGSHEIQRIYLAMFNGLSYPELQPVTYKLDPASGQEYEEIVTNNSVIRKYR